MFISRFVTQVLSGFLIFVAALPPALHTLGFGEMGWVGREREKKTLNSMISRSDTSSLADITELFVSSLIKHSHNCSEYTNFRVQSHLEAVLTVLNLKRKSFN